MSSLSTVALSDLLRERQNDFDAGSLASEVTSVETMRQREGSLRRFLPDKVIRRLDKGFARSATVHPDTGQALFSICRVMQPSVVFETGTYWGYSTTYLAAAVRDNGSGKVHTFDLDPNAGQHFPKSLKGHVEFHFGQPSTDSMPPVLEQGAPQLFFQDSRHDYEGVSEELAVVAPQMKVGGIILFHDFVAPEVSRAAVDMLKDNYSVRILKSDDPQQIGVAVKTA